MLQSPSSLGWPNPRAATAAAGASPATAGDRVARARIAAIYRLRHGRFPDLVRPRRFTELVQQRKLCDRSSWQAEVLDKIAAKTLAAAALGPAWIVPTLWHGSELPGALRFRLPAIVKARHGCNQYAVLEAAPSAAEWHRLRRKGQRWRHRRYGAWLDEWAYRDVPRGLLAEPLLGGRLPLPVDYKIYVFGGEATHVQVHLGRGERHRWILHDRTWRQLVASPDRPAPPAALGAMLDAAETLARGRDFLRLDFYEVERRPWFGEYCLYPGSGYDRFAADWIDEELGALWLAQKAREGAGNEPLIARAPERSAP